MSEVLDVQGRGVADMCQQLHRARERLILLRRVMCPSRRRTDACPIPHAQKPILDVSYNPSIHFFARPSLARGF